MKLNTLQNCIQLQNGDYNDNWISSFLSVIHNNSCIYMKLDTMRDYISIDHLQYKFAGSLRRSCET